MSLADQYMKTLGDCSDCGDPRGIWQDAAGRIRCRICVDLVGGEHGGEHDEPRELNVRGESDG